MEFINWKELKNPIFYNPEWSVKDACMEFFNGNFYLFFSAFYLDRGIERSHVVEIKTKDWINFSDPILHLDGRENGWTGMCSPNITKIDDTYFLTFNSWGDKHQNNRRNKLFYIESKDLENWTEIKPIAHKLTEGNRTIDIAIEYFNEKYYIIWKEDFFYRWRKVRRPKMGIAQKLDGKISYIFHGNPKFYLENGKKSRRIQENFQFLRLNNHWYLLSLDYKPHEPFLYKMKGNGTENKHWLTWVEGKKLTIPQQHFNTNHISNAPFIADWEKHDGYYYMIYAGNTEGRSHARRGDNRLGLARSKDLKDWEVPEKRDQREFFI